MHDFLKNLSSSLFPIENSAEVAWRTKGALTETDMLSEAQIPTKTDLNSRRFNQKSSPARKRKRKDKVPNKMILTDNDNNSFVQNIEKKFDVLYSDDSYNSIDQSSCTNKFMNLTLTEKKNDKSIMMPVSNSCLTD